MPQWQLLRDLPRWQLLWEWSLRSLHPLRGGDLRGASRIGGGGSDVWGLPERNLQCHRQQRPVLALARLWRRQLRDEPALGNEQQRVRGMCRWFVHERGEPIGLPGLDRLSGRHAADGDRVRSGHARVHAVPDRRILCGRKRPCGRVSRGNLGPRPASRHCLRGHDQVLCRQLRRSARVGDQRPHLPALPLRDFQHLGQRNDVLAVARL